ncbi:Proteasome assembly chaperone 4 [Gracilaria domingensis]|nr:Proteasome assembly chaperone 4 [Gracilaria domingensis]
MEVVAFTDQLADLRMRYQITLMKDSVMVWVQPTTDGSLGSFSTLSISMGHSVSDEVLPSASTIFATTAHTASTSYGFAQKLSKRCGLAVYACVDIPDDAAVLEDAIFRRVLDELRIRGVVSSSDHDNGTTEDASLHE